MGELHEKHRQWHFFIVINSVSHQLFLCCNFTLVSLLAHRPTTVQAKGGPQTGYTTYFAHCTHLTTELTVGRRALNCLPLLDHNILFNPDIKVCKGRSGDSTLSGEVGDWMSKRQTMVCKLSGLTRVCKRNKLSWLKSTTEQDEPQRLSLCQLTVLLGWFCFYLCVPDREEMKRGRTSQQTMRSGFAVSHQSTDPPHTTSPAFYLCVST